MQRYTREEFIQRAKAIHGDKYDYSKVEYKNSETRVCIICPAHGEFWQFPNNHINGKQGCSKCYHESVKKPVYGVGINDTDYVFETKDYKIWRNMLERCYCEKTQQKFPTYKGCTVCEEWHLFSNFKKWFHDNYIEGWELDKDIMIIDNKVYSPDTCCFVPREINSFLRRSGVNKHSCIYPAGKGKFRVVLSIDKKHCSLGAFSSFEEAKTVRDEAFKKKLHKVINKYADLLPQRVIDACFSYYNALFI